MFKDVISRGNGCPWGTTGLSSATWLNVRVEVVQISDLVATQPGVFLRPLMDDAPTPVGGDTYPHVILYDGTYYLEDGHHRVLRARLAGHTSIAVRLLKLRKVT